MNENKHYLLTKVKSVGTAYLMWFFLGMHHAYLGNWGRQLLFWFMVTAWFTFGLFSIGNSTVFIIGIGLSLIAVLWYLFDVFFIASYVNEYNKKITDKIHNIELMEQARFRDEQRLSGKNYN